MSQKFRPNRSIGFRDISIFVFCNFCEKFENSKWPPYLARQKLFENWIDTPQRYPVGQKFRPNRSISHGFRDISIFVFCNFCEKFANSKWPPYLTRQIFFENWDRYSAEMCVKNFVEIALSSTVFEI